MTLSQADQISPSLARSMDDFRGGNAVRLSPFEYV